MPPSSPASGSSHDNAMKFKIDENLPLKLAEALRDSGYEADTVADEGLSGASDTVISDVLKQEQRALVTLDLDFSNIRAYPPVDYFGIIILRAHLQDKHSVLELARKFIPMLGIQSLQGSLWIVEPGRIRIRE